ncbi:MAG: amidohydrolase family protein [Anaerolineae bacterium]
MTSPLVIDVHQHSGPWPFTGDTGGIELNLSLMERRGIDIAIISSARAVVQEMVLGNTELADDLSGKSNLYGYVTLNPTWPTLCEREIERFAVNPQFVGYKIHCGYSGCSMGDPRVAVIFNLLEPLARPLLIHTWGAAEVAALQHLAEKHPKLPIIMAHAGGDAWRAGIAAARACSNLFLDFACSTAYTGAIQRALDTIGPMQIVFGSDSTLFDPLYMKVQFDRLDLSEQDRSHIMGGNAQRLFSLSHTT